MEENKEPVSENREPVSENREPISNNRTTTICGILIGILAVLTISGLIMQMSVSNEERFQAIVKVLAEQHSQPEEIIEERLATHKADILEKMQAEMQRQLTVGIFLSILTLVTAFVVIKRIKQVKVLIIIFAVLMILAFLGSLGKISEAGSPTEQAIKWVTIVMSLGYTIISFVAYKAVKNS